MSTTEITFKPEVLSLIGDLITISSSTIVWRDEENIRIAMSDSNRTLAYIMKVPFDYLDVPADIAFYDYKEFYSLFGSIKDSSLFLNEENSKILMSSSKIKIEYSLSPIEKVNLASDDKPLSPKKIPFANPEYEFSLDSKTLAEIKKAISLLKLKTEDAIRLTINGLESFVTFKISNDDNNISWDSVIPANTMTTEKSVFDLILFADHMTRIPSGYDYNVQVITKGDAAGIVKFNIVGIDEAVNVDIFTMVKKAETK